MGCARVGGVNVEDDDDADDDAGDVSFVIVIDADANESTRSDDDKYDDDAWESPRDGCYVRRRPTSERGWW